MRHLFECPTRWADLDTRGRVADAVFVDYLQEARVDMLRVHARDRRADDLAEGVVVVRHEVEYAAPLVPQPEPVLIETWVTRIRAASFTLAYEVFDEGDDGRRVYLRAATVLTPFVFSTERPRRLTDAEREGLAPFQEDSHGPVRPSAGADSTVDPAAWSEQPVRVRWSDVDVYGHVNNVKYFDYFAEGRLPLLEGRHRDVARCDVDYRRPILFRSEPYMCASAAAESTTTSLAVVQEIRDGDEVLARARVTLAPAR